MYTQSSNSTYRQSKKPKKMNRKKGFKKKTVVSLSQEPQENTHDARILAPKVSTNVLKINDTSNQSQSPITDNIKPKRTAQPEDNGHTQSESETVKINHISNGKTPCVITESDSILAQSLDSYVHDTDDLGVTPPNTSSKENNPFNTSKISPSISRDEKSHRPNPGSGSLKNTRTKKNSFRKTNKINSVEQTIGEDIPSHVNSPKNSKSITKIKRIPQVHVDGTGSESDINKNISKKESQALDISENSPNTESIAGFIYPSNGIDENVNQKIETVFPRTIGNENVGLASSSKPTDASNENLCVALAALNLSNSTEFSQSNSSTILTTVTKEGHRIADKTQVSLKPCDNNGGISGTDIAEFSADERKPFKLQVESTEQFVFSYNFCAGYLTDKLSNVSSEIKVENLGSEGVSLGEISGALSLENLSAQTDGQNSPRGTFQEKSAMDSVSSDERLHASKTRSFLQVLIGSDQNIISQAVIHKHPISENNCEKIQLGSSVEAFESITENGLRKILVDITNPRPLTSSLPSNNLATHPSKIGIIRAKFEEYVAESSKSAESKKLIEESLGDKQAKFRISESPISETKQLQALGNANVEVSKETDSPIGVAVVSSTGDSLSHYRTKDIISQNVKEYIGPELVLVPKESIDYLHKSIDSIENEVRKLTEAFCNRSTITSTDKGLRLPRQELESSGPCQDIEMTPESHPFNVGLHTTNNSSENEPAKVGGGSNKKWRFPWPLSGTRPETTTHPAVEHSHHKTSINTSDNPCRKNESLPALPARNYRVIGKVGRK